ncbi:MAG: T9SS type A sorting domain-containing protein [Bacteroidota bacterium]|nr:T9SS type A sorting domain-containing protein [Bacteroidota bacterium]
MRIIFTVFVLVFSVLSSSAAGVIVLEGNYQGKNLYIQNPFAGSSVGFCVFEVRINDRVTSDETNSSAFEIDFSTFQLEIGAAVEVKIMHKDDCKPKVLNPEVLKPKSTFEVSNIKVDKDGVVQWTTKGETGKLPFVVEQFRWNKWVNVGEVEGKGTPVENDYSFKVAPHSGENQLRVKQVDYTGKPRYSSTTKFRSTDPEVSFSPIKVAKEIVFTSETMFEIYDNYGNIVKKGFALKIDVSNLSKGIYYINYDSKMDQFMKK